MRVIAGTARSIPLITPKGSQTRPTADRIKETLFNMLQPYLYDAVFADLFAGSGGIGIEALSRGAAKAVFVDYDRDSLRCIRANLAKTGLEEWASVIPGDVLAVCRRLEGREYFDILFIDPPYQAGIEEKLFDFLALSSIIDEHSLIILEADSRQQQLFLERYGFVVEKRKCYGSNQHVFIRKKGRE
ncbi:MAG: 16S rRNA (guanine(966)-N(2))-methyltransferase RsmD [Lachnospiraceae bacterium]|nr:16S rRNA (guanine(966)-N(2))-methyltransferase RsmD [Lachnospiraceae bacterium]